MFPVPPSGRVGLSMASKDSEQTARAAQGSMTDAQRRLKAGEISVDDYLDHCMELALARFRGKLTGEQLEVLRETLRNQLLLDPVLVELVRRATSQEPPGPLTGTNR